MKLPKRRRQCERTCRDLVNRVTARAIRLCQGQTPLLPRVHLRVGASKKNQIADNERHEMAADINFIEKLGAHGFAPIAGLISI